MPTSHTFAYRIIDEPQCKPTNYPTSREDYYWAMVRALASQPLAHYNLKDEESLTFKDPKTGCSFRIQFHDIKL